MSGIPYLALYRDGEIVRDSHGAQPKRAVALRFGLDDIALRAA
ncbi:MAG: hypothetical protein ACR2NA_05805 [Solirubrobacterales bacterium]